MYRAGLLVGLLIVAFVAAGCTRSSDDSTAIPASISQPTATPVPMISWTPASVGDEAMVDVGGRRLHVVCVGSGSPTVLFEHGLGNSAEEWSSIQRALSADYRACAYSRAGQGKSEPLRQDEIAFRTKDEDLPSTDVTTGDLARLLDATDIGPPYILVGHSLGGIYIRLFAEQNPESIAGIVFVDASHPDQGEGRGIAALRRAGIAEEVIEELRPPDELPDELFQAAAGTGPFDSIPIAVLSRDSERELDPLQAQGILGPPPYIQRILDAEWDAMQAELAELSTNSSITVVDGVDHFIHLSSPQAVVAAVKGVAGGED